jgi:CBS domain-containing protein
MNQKAALVKDYMVGTRAFVQESDSVTAAVKVLLENKLSGTAVVNEDHHVIGFISEQDCLKHLISDAYYHDQSAIVSDVMSTNLVCVSPNTTILEIADKMSGASPTVMPVVDDQKLVGEITRHEVVQALFNAQK